MTTVLPAFRPVPRPILLALVALIGASGILLASARPVAACSCAEFQTMKDFATADNAVFTGTAGVREQRGVPVTVDQWFWGRGAAPVVWLAAASFGDGSSCGTDPPPPGSAWIWVTWLPPDGGDPMTGLCSPSGELTTPEGRKMLAEATEVFSGLAQPATPTPTEAPPVAAPTTPVETAPPDPAAVARDQATMTIALALGGVVIVLFGGLVLLARRPGRPTDRP
ncbi:MAG TPA: hypothetical protein VFK35_05050 [Candidatus Limnocylindrales bacterium]|nr:hypothetical protein [Candidatus Limnocylindrales bacterium]